ncbi:MAG: tRNA-dihydrouridine synthase [Elusimicrobiales bacterium]|nr:tRNA-dihydrouridine synthase [Elusimicrobiales bacterium]
MTPLAIGGVICKNNLALAPMAGITDSPLRALCLRGGAGLVCAEMVAAPGIQHGNPRTGRMLKLDYGEHPCAMQIFGGDDAAVACAVAAAKREGADIIDINAGCPVPKIVKAGAGIALMKDEAAFARMIAAAVKAAGATPVTVKTRVGLRQGEVLSVKLARIAEGEGAAAVFLHGRYASMAHAGPLDCEAMSATAAAVKIPVIGNGGVCGSATAAEVLKTGCAGVMIGRAAIGNPFIFEQICAELSGAAYQPLDARSRARIFLELLDMCVLRYGPRTGLNRSRKTAGYFITGFPNCAAVRTRFMGIDNHEQARRYLAAALH